MQGYCKSTSKYYDYYIDECPFTCTDGTCKKGGNSKCQDQSYGCAVFKKNVSKVAHLCNYE